MKLDHYGKLSKTDAKNCVNKWLETPVHHLGNCFEVKGAKPRLQAFKLKEVGKFQDYLHNLIEAKIQNNIPLDSLVFMIQMAIDHKGRFMPIINLEAEEVQKHIRSGGYHYEYKSCFHSCFCLDQHYSGLMESGEPPEGWLPYISTKRSSGAVPVPARFIELATNVWNKVPTSMINDLFMSEISFTNAARTSTRNRSPERINGFVLKNQKGREINRILACTLLVLATKNVRLIDFKFHLGADFNKVSVEDLFAFTPVVEIVVDDTQKFSVELDAMLNDTTEATERTNEVLASSRDGVQDANSTPSSIFLEFLFPCPPTCEL